MKATVRPFREEDAGAVSALKIKTLRITNRKDYSPEYIEDLAGRMTPGDVLEQAKANKTYVAEAGGVIAGCGAVGYCPGKTEEVRFSSIFVVPEYQGQGIGKQIVKTLEEDEISLKARKIEIDASITAIDFYLKLGYVFSEGVREPDGRGLVKLVKMQDGSRN